MLTNCAVWLDTTFLANWGRFDQFCRKEQSDGPYPYDAFDFALKQGNTLIVPNDVLKDMTYTPNDQQPARGMQLGLGSRDGQARLSMREIVNCKSSSVGSKQFLNFLMVHEDAIRTFASAADYYTAEASGALGGKIAIVSDKALQPGSGLESVSKNGTSTARPEREALDFIRKQPASAAPQCLLTCEPALAKEFRSQSWASKVKTQTFFPRAFSDFISGMGMQHAWDRSAAKIGQDAKLRNDIILGQPSERSMLNHIKAFIDQCDGHRHGGVDKTFGQTVLQQPRDGGFRRT